MRRNRLRPARASRLARPRLHHAAAPAGKLAQRIGKAVRRAGAASVSRVYPDVNESAPRDYWDYEALAVTWGDQDAYEVVKKVGRGKYSEVFEGVKTSSDERCIIKARLPCNSSLRYCALPWRPCSHALPGIA